MNKGSAAWQAIVATPLGPLGVTTDGEGVTGIDFLSPVKAPKPAETVFADRAVNALEHYFLDASYGFTLPLHAVGTEFQQSVWRLLREIPLGQVWTYGEMARQLGSSPRAVGNACRRNPLPVIVPCHRVVGAQGLGGYAGETKGRNMEIKRWLLAHEGVGLPL